MPHDLISDLYLTEKEVITILNLTKEQFAFIKRTKNFPKPIEIKQNIKKYKIDEIISWKDTYNFDQTGGFQ